MKRKRFRSVSVEEARPSARLVVGVHPDVQAALRDWGKTKIHNAVATKVTSLLKALVRNEQAVVDAILKQLAVQNIHEMPGLVELGPKQSRGGAARLFLWRGESAAFFVAAGIEKGSRGLKATIETARGRAKVIRETLSKVERGNALRALSTPEGPYTLIDQ
jgi:hypothetical protein